MSGYYYLVADDFHGKTVIVKRGKDLGAFGTSSVSEKQLVHNGRIRPIHYPVVTYLVSVTRLFLQRCCGT